MIFIIISPLIAATNYKYRDQALNHFQSKIGQYLKSKVLPPDSKKSTCLF